MIAVELGGGWRRAGPESLSSACKGLLGVVPDAWINDPPFPCPLVLGALQDPGRHRRVPPELDCRCSHSGPIPYQIERPLNLGRCLRIHLYAS